MKEAVFFDLDKTITRAKTEQVFGLYLLNKKEISFFALIQGLWYYLLYDLGLLKDYEQNKKHAIEKIAKNKNSKNILNLYNEFYKTNLKNTIYNEMRQIIDEHKKQNREIFVISAAPNFIVKSFCDDLGIKNYYSTNWEIKNDFFTGKVIGNIQYGKTKGDTVKNIADKENIDLSKSYAYGDHISDIYMLEEVGNPTVVNPSKNLKKMAENRGWKISIIKF
jgi:HAD superfamily hydrolase (TIGR01490 family)